MSDPPDRQAEAAGSRLGRFLTRLWQLIEHSVEKFLDDRGPQLSAGIAYYVLFSILPLTIVLTAAFGLVVNDTEARDEVVDFIVDRLPLGDSGADEIRTGLEQVTANARTVGLLGVLALLYSASALMGAVRNSLNAAWSIHQGRPPLRGKAIDILLILLIGSLFATTFAIDLLTGIASDAGRDIGLPDAFVNGGLRFAASLLPFVISLVVITIAYRFVPDRRSQLRDIWPGILVGAAGFELTRFGFGIYLENFARYSAVYGSLGAIVATMVFIYVSAIVFMIGAEVAAMWSRVRRGEFDQVSDEPGESFWSQVWGLLKGLVLRQGEEERRDGGTRSDADRRE